MYIYRMLVDPMLVDPLLVDSRDFGLGVRSPSLAVMLSAMLSWSLLYCLVSAAWQTRWLESPSTSVWVAWLSWLRATVSISGVGAGVSTATLGSASCSAYSTKSCASADIARQCVRLLISNASNASYYKSTPSLYVTQASATHDTPRARHKIPTSTWSTSTCLQAQGHKHMVYIV
jgi:hypothetical protein